MGDASSFKNTESRGVSKLISVVGEPRLPSPTVSIFLCLENQLSKQDCHQGDSDVIHILERE